MITLQWYRLRDMSGATYFRLFEVGKSGGDWLAGIDRSPAGRWVYTFQVPAGRQAPGWGQTGSPRRSLRLANEILHAKCYAILGDDVHIVEEIHNG